MKNLAEHIIIHLNQRDAEIAELKKSLRYYKNYCSLNEPKICSVCDEPKIEYDGIFPFATECSESGVFRKCWNYRNGCPFITCEDCEYGYGAINEVEPWYNLGYSNCLLDDDFYCSKKCFDEIIKQDNEEMARYLEKKKKNAENV